MSAEILDEMIRHPGEERNIEFKQSTKWEDIKFKAKIAKTILGMANIRDGGWIVIGKTRKTDGTYEATGMIQTDIDSFNQDLMQDFVRDYADPEVDFTLQRHSYASKSYIVIRVEEFESVPILCKKDCAEILHRGKMYVRSKAKPETIEVPSQSEMREVIEMATEKDQRHLIERLSRLGLAPPEKKTEATSDKELFDQELKDVL